MYTCRFLTFDPVQRVTAEDALHHDYFKEAPLPIDPAMFPTWPAKSELGHRKATAASPKPPPGGHEYKQLVSSKFLIKNEYKRKTWKGKMVKNMLTRRKESDTYLATVSRHRWSRQITTKVDKLLLL